MGRHIAQVALFQRGHFFAFLHHHQFLVARVGEQRAQQVAQQDGHGGHAQHHATGVEDAHRRAGDGRLGVPVDLCLHPAALEQQPRHIQHGHLGQHQTDFFAQAGQARHQRISAQVAVLAQGHHSAHERQPHKQPARDFFGHGQARVEGVAQHHVAEDQHHHDGEEQAPQHVQRSCVAPQNAVHQIEHGCLQSKRYRLLELFCTNWLVLMIRANPW